MKQYLKRIEPEKYRWISDEILNRFNSDQPDSIIKLAVVHRVLYKKLDYHHSGSKAVHPDNFLDQLSGDCQDHATTLATLYKAAWLQPAILRVKTQKGHHILVEVKNPLSRIEEACNALRNFYWKQYSLFAPKISYETREGSHWFVVDTAGDQGAGWSRYVGDITTHIDSSIEETENGEWEWKNLAAWREV